MCHFLTALHSVNWHLSSASPETLVLRLYYNALWCDLYCIYWTYSPKGHVSWLFICSGMAHPSTASTVHLSSKIKLSSVGACVSTVITIGELFCHSTFIFSVLSCTSWHYMIVPKQKDWRKISDNHFHPFSINLNPNIYCTWCQDKNLNYKTSTRGFKIPNSGENSLVLPWLTPKCWSNLSSV